MPSVLLFVVGMLGVVGIVWTLRREGRSERRDLAGDGPLELAGDGRLELADGLASDGLGLELAGDGRLDSPPRTCSLHPRVAGPPSPVPTRRGALTCTGFGGSDDVSIDGPDELVSCPACAGIDPEVVFFSNDLAVRGCSHCMMGEP